MSKPTVGWWEIMLADKESSDKAKKFMSEVFGWKIDSANEYDYGLVSPEDAGVGGGIGPTQPGSPPRSTIYLSVPSIDEYLQKIEKAGGRTVLPKVTVASSTIALFTDPVGTVIGLLEAS